MNGFVSFVGAGPGDPKLLTLRGRDILERCDAVVYDHLIDPRVLEFALNAEKIYGGKQSGRSGTAAQKKIERLLIRLARSGKKVVRLKGGDPLIFGRWGEEALALVQNKIPFEVVPGISAGFAAPAYAGIPVTHRDFASSVTFLTAHEGAGKKKSFIDWKTVARLQGTLVLFMGMGNLAHVARLLVSFGKSPNTPVSVIEWGTAPGQKTVSGTLATIVREVKRKKLSAPAVAVIGEVSRLGKKLNWFERKPLFGTGVLITRAYSQVSHLRESLDVLGADIKECPMIDILPLEHFNELDGAILRIRHFHWLVFTSENGVNAFFDRLKTFGRDARLLAHSKIAAVGLATAARLRARGIEPDLIPEDFSSEGLIESFKRMGVFERNILLLRTDIAPDSLPKALHKLGAYVQDTAAYRTRAPKQLKQKLKELSRQSNVRYVLFTSSSTARNFFEAGGKALFRNAKFISIGPETSKTIRSFKAKVTREAKPHNVSGLVKAISRT